MTPSTAADALAFVPDLTLSMSDEECAEYVEQADQTASEMFAEWGMGASSLGYDPGEWAPAYDGYRTSEDATYQECRRRLEPPAPPAPHPTVAAAFDDDLPF